MNEDLEKLTGFANRKTVQQWRQLGTTSATVTVNFYALKPVNGDAVLSVLKAGAIDCLAYIDSATKTFYQGEIYTGGYTKVRVSSGVILIRLMEA